MSAPNGLNALQPPSISLSVDLSHWLNQLYIQARKQPLVDFKQWCFSSLQPLLPFDSGLWATRSDLLELRREHWVDDTCLINQPDEFMANYAQIDSALGHQDPLNQHLVKHPGQFFTLWDCCPKEQWHNSDYYLKHCRLFGVENAISALSLPSSNSAVSHVFSFYRANASDEFTPSETLLADFILPNLIEAFRINVLSTFDQTEHKGGSFRAVLDRYGEMMEAEAGFCHLMQTKGLLNKTRVSIPELQRINATAELELAGLKLVVVFTNGLFYLETSEGLQLQSLSRREYQILQLLSTGLGSKAIANQLTTDDPSQPIKTNTVNSHLNNIYKKLGVEHKAAATGFFLTYAAKVKRPL